MPLRIRIRGLELTFSFWFFVVILLFVQLGKEMMALYIALPVLIHEAGHLLAMLLLGVRIKAVDFTPFSVRIRRQTKILSYGGEITIALAGITANLISALALYLFAFQSMRTMLMAASHIAVAIFNLLPIGSLDGGQACKLVCQRFFTPRLAYSISRGFSFFALTPLFALAGFLCMQGIGNITLPLTCVYLAAAVIFRE